MDFEEIQKDISKVYEMTLHKERISRNMHISSEAFEDRTVMKAALEWSMDRAIVALQHNVYGRDGIEGVIDHYEHPKTWWMMLVESKGWDRFYHCHRLPEKIRNLFWVEQKTIPITLKHFFHCSHVAIPPRQQMTWPILEQKEEDWEKQDHTAELHGFRCQKCYSEMERVSMEEMDRLRYPIKETNDEGK